MTDDRPFEVLGALPRTRPHRRSEKRAARPVGPPPGAVEPGSKPVGPESKPVGPESKPAGPESKPAGEPKSTGASKTKSAATPPVTRSASAARPRPKARRLPQPAQPDGTPATARARKPAPTGGPDLLGTAVQAAAELAEIGLSVSARALRRAVSRLPRP